MFIKRLISGIVLVLMAVVLIDQGGKFLLATAFLLSIIGLFELYRAFQLEKSLPGMVGYVVTAIYYILIYQRALYYSSLLFASTLMILMGIYVFTFPRYKTEAIMAAFFGIFYVSVMFSYLYQTRSLFDGRYLVWLIVISSWGSDTCAYVVGMLFGKHKIAPELSPKKSWEGCIGGVVGSAILGMLFAYFFRSNIKDLYNPVLAAGISCAIGSVISQVGDFAASAIKRNHNIKDFGHLIPGHGGVLDRFDSVLFTAPIVYFALILFQ